MVVACVYCCFLFSTHTHCTCTQAIIVTGGFGIPSHHIKREARNRNPELKLPKQQLQVNGGDPPKVLSRETTPLPPS